MRRFLYILIILVSVASCKDGIFTTDDADVVYDEGEAVRFITNVPSMTKSTRGYSLNEEVIRSYATVQEEYAIRVQMYEQGNTTTPVGTSTYKPITNVTGSVISYDEDGTLEPLNDADQLYWITNQKAYAFKASAGTDEIESDQSTKLLWLSQDRLEGYGYTPLKNDDNSDVDNINRLNFHTNKEWGTLNRAWRDLDNSNQMLSTEHYKAIPLFMQHQRSWITLKLKAGNGVSRESLKFEDAQKNGSVTFYSYKGDAKDPFVVERSWAQPDTVNYGKDKNGDAQKGYETTAYNVIVEPHNYNSNAESHQIASISLSGLKFTFSAKNDYNYEASVNSGASGHDAALVAMNAYNLEPGKHLTITATLTTDRIVFITAWIEDWTTIATTTICDDYGQNGDPILINSRQDLIDFLQGNDNKSGNVAIVVANTLDLDKKITTERYTKAEADAHNEAHKNDANFKKVQEGDIKSTTSTDDSWSNYATGFDLKATLNLAGARINSNSRFLKTVSSSGSVINGTFVVEGNVASAIAETNAGTLERINVTAGEGDFKASRAGLVVTNRGTIYQCASALPVYGVNDADTTMYVGGIAAESSSKDGTTMPVIDGCTVMSAVKGPKDNVIGGGIVGHAEGRVTNNTFEYGITLLQNSTHYKNIVGARTNSELRAQNNSWPTTATNSFDGADAANVNANTSARYNNVLDCQEELQQLLTSTYNKSEFKYRISNSFTVNSETWQHGEKHDNTNHTGEHSGGNLYCELDGNNMTITLDGSKKVNVPKDIDDKGKATSYEEFTTSAMLFSNITGSVHDLTLYLAKPLIAQPATNNDILDATDAIAPLAYAVTGKDAVIKNVKVKTANDAYIQAALPAGVVCWAYGGATVDGCQVKAKIQSWIPTTSIKSEEGGTSDARRYAGGIVGLAAKATIKECVFHTDKETLLPVKSTTAQVFYGGILGGTLSKSSTSLTEPETPSVTIVDCISWFEPEEKESRKGAILGYSIWNNNNHQQDGTNTTACMGNWWNTTYKGVASVIAGQTIEGAIGKCNSYTPTKDIDF